MGIFNSKKKHRKVGIADEKKIIIHEQPQSLTVTVTVGNQVIMVLIGPIYV